MRLLKIDDTVRLIGVNAVTLRRWRDHGCGPRFVRLGPRLIRYREDDVDEFLNPGAARRRADRPKK